MMSAADLAHPKTGLLSDAVISPCGQYRYWLHRAWNFGVGWTVFIMLNPSKADASINDPSIRRCIDFAKRFGSRGLIVVNLFAARATNPEALGRFNDPEGPENHAYVLKACEFAAEPAPDFETDEIIQPGKLVCAWGAHWMREGQDQTVMGWIEASGAEPLCLGVTKSGAPKHPLYLPRSTPLQPFQLRRQAA